MFYRIQTRGGAKYHAESWEGRVRAEGETSFPLLSRFGNRSVEELVQWCRENSYELEVRATQQAGWSPCFDRKKH